MLRKNTPIIFRIEKEKKKRFQKICRKRKLYMSEVLIAYINQVIEENELD